MPSFCVRLFAVLLLLVLSAKASPPEDLTNFLNELSCDSGVRLVRPRTHSDVEEAVKRHARVKAMGVGHSYNDFTCAPSPEDTPEDDTSANIVMTTIRPLKIEIDEVEMSAWVSAGVTVWDLMEYLGNYNTPASPRGYSLASGSPPYVVNQTIGGAIATGTHGISVRYGSPSNQVIGFRVVLANGTTTEIYPDSHPLYFRAFQVNVGRLGVVTDVKLRIQKEVLIERTLLIDIPQEEFMPRIREAQDIFTSTGSLPEWFDNWMFFWDPVNHTFVLFTLEEAESQPEAEFDGTCEGSTCNFYAPAQESLRPIIERINAPLNATRNDDGLDVADGVTWDDPEPIEINPLFADPANTPIFVQASEDTFTEYTSNDTVDTHRADLNPPISQLPGLQATLHDHYEISVPAEKMADCMEAALEFVDSQAPNFGLRNLAIFRPNGQETGLLSIAHDGPRLWIGLQDFVYYNQEERQSNVPMRELVGFLVSSPLCSPARLHWGFAGWPDSGCYHGAELYPDTWCDFGCVVRDLDPEDKFISNDPEVWNWDGADLDKCCTANGYDKSLPGCDCAVVRRRNLDDCPEAPYYSDR